MIKSHFPARKENEKRHFIIPKDKTKILFVIKDAEIKGDGSANREA